MFKKVLFRKSRLVRKRVLKDKNIDVVVIAEGEITVTDILKRTLNNNKRFPDKEELKDVPGIAFLKESGII